MQLGIDSRSGHLPSKKVKNEKYIHIRSTPTIVKQLYYGKSVSEDLNVKQWDTKCLFDERADLNALKVDL